MESNQTHNEWVGDVGLAADVQAVLMEKIRRLERELEAARETARQAERHSIEHILRPLRGRETVLLYFGKESAQQYAEMLQEDFSEETALVVMRDSFFVNGAPMDAEQQDALRGALRERRWFPV